MEFLNMDPQSGKIFPDRDLSRISDLTLLDLMVARLKERSILDSESVDLSSADRGLVERFLELLSEQELR